MKTFLAACVAFGALTFTALPHANAEVVVGVPGVHLRVGPPPRPHYGTGNIAVGKSATTGATTTTVAGR